MRTLIILLIVVTNVVYAQKTISSPDKNVTVSVAGGNSLMISARYKNT